LGRWDEAIYAQVSKEMIESGDWLTPHWEYKPWFHKPPLLMWLTAIFYRLFEVNEFWSRAASAFSGIGLVITTYLVGKLIYDTYTGFLAAVILLTSYHFVGYARFGTTDVMLTLFTFVAVYAYLRLKQGSQLWWYAIWNACALALLVKGAAGVIAPAVIVSALLLDKRLVAAAQSRHFWQGLLSAIAVVAPWHILMSVKYGWAFIEEYIGYHVITRTMNAIEGHQAGRIFYVDELHTYFYPWFYLTPFALAISIGENIKGQSRSRILLLLIMIVFGIYTAAQSKLSWYILPVYPALSVLVAFVVTQAFASFHSLAFSGLLVGAFMVALTAPVGIVLICGCIGILIICFSVATKRPAYRWVPATVCTLLLVVGAHQLLSFYREGETPVAVLARAARTTNPYDHEPLIVFTKSAPPADYSDPAALFYSNRPILLARTLEDVTRFTDGHQAKRIILEKADLEILSNGYEVYVLAESEPDVYATIRRRGMQ